MYKKIKKEKKKERKNVYGNSGEEDPTKQKKALKLQNIHNQHDEISNLVTSSSTGHLVVGSSVGNSCRIGRIVAHKKATLDRLKPSSEKVSVSIDIYNHGSATAYDVSLTDDGWSPEIFSIIAGNTSTSWERFDVGGLLSHSFVLESKVKTTFYRTPAVITYHVPTKAALQEAYTTSLLPLEILSDKPHETKLDLVQKLLGKYGSLISVISIVVLFFYLLVTPPPKSGASKGSKKRR